MNRIMTAVLILPLWTYAACTQNQTGDSWLTPIASWDSGGNETIRLNEPQALSISPAGLLYVSDTGNHRILCLNASGVLVGQIGGFGWGPQQFNKPLGISAQNGLDVLVADNLNHRIERYDKDLHYLATLQSSETWDLRLWLGFPRDVALSKQGELFCIDGENHRILKVDVLGTPQMSFGDFDSGIGRLRDPQRMMIWKDRLYISDSNPGRIVVYDLYGNCLSLMGEGFLSAPRGMAAVDDRILAVVDAGSSSLMLLDINGRLLLRQELDSTQEPVDVAFWKGILYVLDRKQGRIDLFRLHFSSEPGSK